MRATVLTDETAFTRLLNEADKYGAHLGVDRSVLIGIFSEETDWAFTIKVDALHETAGRHLIARLMSMRSAKVGQEICLSGFVESLPYQGRSSIIQLLKTSGCRKDDVHFLQCVRRVRNAFVHDVRSIGRSLLDMVEALPDRSELLKQLSYIEEQAYSETDFLEIARKEEGLLRFGILQHSMAFLYIMNAAFPYPAGPDAAFGDSAKSV